MSRRGIHHLLLTLVACLAFAIGGATAPLASLLAPGEELSSPSEQSEGGEAAVADLAPIGSPRHERTLRRPTAHGQVALERRAVHVITSSRTSSGPPAADTWTRPRRC